MSPSPSPNGAEYLQSRDRRQTPSSTLFSNLRAFFMSPYTRSTSSQEENRTKYPRRLSLKEQQKVKRVLSAGNASHGDDTPSHSIHTSPHLSSIASASPPLSESSSSISSVPSSFGTASSIAPSQRNAFRFSSLDTIPRTSHFQSFYSETPSSSIPGNSSRQLQMENQYKLPSMSSLASQPIFVRNPMRSSREDNSMTGSSSRKSLLPQAQTASTDRLLDAESISDTLNYYKTPLNPQSIAFKPTHITDKISGRKRQLSLMEDETSRTKRKRGIFLRPKKTKTKRTGVLGNSLLKSKTEGRRANSEPIPMIVQFPKDSETEQRLAASADCSPFPSSPLNKTASISMPPIMGWGLSHVPPSLGTKRKYCATWEDVDEDEA